MDKEVINFMISFIIISKMQQCVVSIVQGVCPKCNMESTDGSGAKRIFCIICWEEREVIAFLVGFFETHFAS